MEKILETRTGSNRGIVVASKFFLLVTTTSQKSYYDNAFWQQETTELVRGSMECLVSFKSP